MAYPHYIEAAAEQILEACLKSSAPLATMTNEIRRLQTQFGWTSSDVVQVERAVQERLVQIYGR